MAFELPSEKRPRSESFASLPPFKRTDRTPVNRSRRTYVSFHQVVRQVIDITLKSEYTYTPIRPDEIRLLIIHPSANLEDPVFCELETATSGEHPYEALSYTWGTDEPIHEIKIYSFKPGLQKPSLKASMWAKVYVRSNLHAALRYLRDPVRKTTLWVDALCINQNDKVERRIQVSKMAEIYSQAYNVCIWLGVGDIQSKMALEFIPNMLAGNDLDRLVTDESTSGYWHSLAVLMRNQWFSRRWVVQEVAHAKEASLCCGHNIIHWDDFADAISLFVERFDEINKLVQSSRQFGPELDPLGNVKVFGANIIVETTNNLFRRTIEGEVVERLASLETLVSTLLTFDVTDPRDAIYAVLSIAKDTFPSAAEQNTLRSKPPVPDYEKGLVEVCKDFVEYCVESSGSLDIICRHWAPAVKEKKQSLHEKLKMIRPPAKEMLPSWIPSVAKSPFGTPDDVLNGRVSGDSFVGNPNQKNYDATPGTVAIVRFGDNMEDYLSPHLRSNSVTSNDRFGIANDADAFSEGSISNNSSPLGGRSAMHSPVRQAFSRLPQQHHAKSAPPRGLQIPPPSSAPHLLALTTPRDNGISGFSPNTSAQRSESPFADPKDHSWSPRSPTSQPAVPQSASIPLAQSPLPMFIDPGSSRLQTASQKSKSDSTMYVRGIRLDSISELSSRIASGLIPRECLEMGLRGSTSFDSTQVPRVPDELWRTLVADRGADGKNPPPWYHRACQHCLAQSTTSGDIDIPKLIEKGKPVMMVAFLKRVLCVIWSRKFLRTKGGGAEGKRSLFGLAPERAKKGDWICVLLGCSVPVVLREQRTPTDRYFEFVGEAYVYGMMDGEALGGRKMAELREMSEEFKLR